MLLVLIGAAVVGVASVLYPDANSKSASDPLLGDILIVVAQVVTAVQMVVEEKLEWKGHSSTSSRGVGRCLGIFRPLVVL